MAPPPIKHKALLNVDLGEAYGNFKCGPDDEIIPLIDHANVACGVSGKGGHQMHSYNGQEVYEAATPFDLLLTFRPPSSTPVIP